MKRTYQPSIKKCYQLKKSPSDFFFNSKKRREKMKKEFRIKKTQEFAEILNYKKFYTCPSFAIYVKPKKRRACKSWNFCWKEAW